MCFASTALTYNIGCITCFDLHLDQHADTSGPESAGSRASKGSKVNVPAAQQKVQVINSTSIAPDVVIEVEGTQQARDRGHVIIAIDNLDPDLEVQTVAKKERKRKGCAVCFDCC